MLLTHKQCKAKPTGIVESEVKPEYEIYIYFTNLSIKREYTVGYNISKTFGAFTISDKDFKRYDFTEDGHGLAVLKYIEYRDLIDKNMI